MKVQPNWQSCQDTRLSVPTYVAIHIILQSFATWKGGNESQRKQKMRRLFWAAQSGVCEAAVVGVTCKRTGWASTTSTNEACADQQGIPITQTQHRIHISITIAARKANSLLQPNFMVQFMSAICVFTYPTPLRALANISHYRPWGYVPVFTSSTVPEPIELPLIPLSTWVKLL